jgi:hypothetical protein
VHPPLPLEKKCWEMEFKAQVAYRGTDDPEYAPGQHLLVGRSTDE